MSPAAGAGTGGAAAKGGFLHGLGYLCAGEGGLGAADIHLLTVLESSAEPQKKGEGSGVCAEFRAGAGLGGGWHRLQDRGGGHNRLKSDSEKKIPLCQSLMAYVFGEREPEVVSLSLVDSSAIVPFWAGWDIPCHGLFS